MHAGVEHEGQLGNRPNRPQGPRDRFWPEHVPFLFHDDGMVIEHEVSIESPLPGEEQESDQNACHQHCL